MTLISVQDDECWVCQNKPKFAMHHVIPKHLLPKNNILIPICQDCHRRIHEVDFGAVHNYIFKIYKLLENNKIQIAYINKIIEKKIGDTDGEVSKKSYTI